MTADPQHPRHAAHKWISQADDILEESMTDPGYTDEERVVLVLQALTCAVIGLAEEVDER